MMHQADCPIPAEAVAALQVLRDCFGDSLVAAWLHGSAVAGGLRPDSDVDVMAVIAGSTTPVVGALLASELLRISGRPGAGGQRPLELTVFRRDDLAAGDFPARCAFIYGEWLRGDFEAGVFPGPEPDPEMTVLLAQARAVARPLAGPEAADLLPAVPPAALRRAIGEALEPLLATLEGDERNVLLTLARMWRTLSTGDIVPKDVAAAWAAARLPGKDATLVGMAREAYLGVRRDDWSARRQQARRVADRLQARVTALL